MRVWLLMRIWNEAPGWTCGPYFSVLDAVGTEPEDDSEFLFGMAGAN